MANILICDDDVDIVSALKIYLSNEDYKIYTAFTGKQALDCVKEHDIDLVLMDVMMPEMDGIAATAKLREEYNILHLLMRNPNRVFSSTQIYELVWNENAYGSESAVAVHIRHLREKIEINPSEPRYIKVVWGQGYKMEGKK